MSRETYVYREGLGVIPKSEAPPLVSGPAIIRDHMDSTWHPASGKMYDSKSEFRRATKAAGCIEMGDQPIVPRSPQRKMSNERRAMDIKRSIEQLQSR